MKKGLVVRAMDGLISQQVYEDPIYWRQAFIWHNMQRNLGITFAISGKTCEPDECNDDVFSAT